MDLSDIQCEPGSDDKLGATCDDSGVNFAIFSANATKIELCLFDDTGTKELRRITLPQKTGDIWHGYIPGLKAGQVYGYRVYGPYDPANGQLFNPNKLLLDPYAKETVGEVHWTDNVLDPAKDSAPHTIKARVTQPLPPKTTQAPNVPADKTVIYELHPKGYTMTDPAIPADKRGTIEALGSPQSIEALKKLGITTVELMPVHAKLDEQRLSKDGLKNYWGYNTIGFFAMQPELLASGKREEFRVMIDNLHKAGIEVVLDVVYNHTAEEGNGGPLLSLRGIDNASYYRLDPKDKTKNINDTGCGNTLNMDHPQVRRMVLDSLKYWVEEFGVDGFRFDLASVLGKVNGKFKADAPFFKEIAQDEVLSKVKMIAEPWDVTAEGYQVGNFPKGWMEWNGKFRDDVRRFWRGDNYMTGALATRLAGSSPEYDHDGRTPQETINFITCHDGFTLEDLVSYNQKHNLDNKEDNRDGSNDNNSANNGVEGETADPEILKIRQQQKRNMLATLFLAQGTPMLLAGDEAGNSQQGNNNAYCQDNAIGWMKKDDPALAAFAEKLIEFRKENAALTQKRYLHGQQTDADGIADLQWYSQKGQPTSNVDWNSPDNKSFGMLLNEGAMDGKKTGKRLFAVFNAAATPVPFKMPDLPGGQGWQRVLDTSEPSLDPKQPSAVGKDYLIPAHSVVVFTQDAKLSA